MLFLVYLRDIPDNTGLRARLLDEHMEYVSRHIDRIRLGGPLLRDDGDVPAGGLLIVEADSADEVRAMLDADPYYQAGLWDEVRIQPFRALINAWP